MFAAGMPILAASLFALKEGVMESAQQQFVDVGIPYDNIQVAVIQLRDQKIVRLTFFRHGRSVYYADASLSDL